ncbi:MAG: amidohydrolase family protein [Pseudomonadota bacterium]
MPFDVDLPLLPIKLDSTSNGEFLPRPLAREHHQANRAAREEVAIAAKRTACDRRKFLTSAAAASATLLAFNEVYSAAGLGTGGFFEIPADAAFDNALAARELGSSDFIFDVQGHYVVPPSLVRTLKPRCRSEFDELSRRYMECIGADAFIKDIFLDSDTDFMVLSFIPSRRDAEPLTALEAVATRSIVERMEGSQRLLIHGRVNPNQDGDIDDMEELSEQGVVAWKCYTQWGPDGRGFFLYDEDCGIPFIEKARSLGIKRICIHKGIPFGRQSYEHSLCGDIGRVARQFPDVDFLIYHSGYVPGQTEGPYDKTRVEGLDGLINAALDEAGRPLPNVYAELGTTWRFLLRNPTEAGHALGKLLKYLGEDQILYGSDCVWYGSPQDQIQALRTFQISDEFIERFGYPKITAATRAKIFGQNAARVYGVGETSDLVDIACDPVSRLRENYKNSPSPHFRSYGPKTASDFRHLQTFAAG